MKNNTKQSEKFATNKTENEANNIQQLKPLNLGDNQGFTCNAETGLCGPTNYQKEVKK